jgi:SDR family mycofactocin-dependent oxidoreductase
VSGRLEGKVAIITGAGRGQGRSHSVRLAEEGCDIIAVDWCRNIDSNVYDQASSADLAETVRLVEALGRRIVPIVADVRERSEMMAAVKKGVDELGHLDIVIAQAGIAPLGPDVPVQGFVDSVSIMFSGILNTIDASLSYLSAGASIIATGSVAGLMQGATNAPGMGPGGAGYSHAKRAVARLGHDLAFQLAPHSIRMNVVHPTNCSTDMLFSEPMYKSFRPDLENPTKEDAMLAFPAMQAMPIPYVEPVDISNAIVFLCSDEARYITGMQFRIDGGALLTHSSSGAPA